MSARPNHHRHCLAYDNTAPSIDPTKSPPPLPCLRQHSPVHRSLSRTICRSLVAIEAELAERRKGRRHPRPTGEASGGRESKASSCRYGARVRREGRWSPRTGEDGVGEVSRQGQRSCPPGRLEASSTHRGCQWRLRIDRQGYHCSNRRDLRGQLWRVTADQRAGRGVGGGVGVGVREARSMRPRSSSMSSP